jgi:hypothetical protein
MNTNVAHVDWEPVQRSSAEHYVVCLDCGQHLSYDWSQMRIIYDA